jgi:hypothetical protein
MIPTDSSAVTFIQRSKALLVAIQTRRPIEAMGIARTFNNPIFRRHNKIRSRRSIRPEELGRTRC